MKLPTRQREIFKKKRKNPSGQSRARAQTQKDLGSCIWIRTRAQTDRARIRVGVFMTGFIQPSLFRVCFFDGRVPISTESTKIVVGRPLTASKSGRVWPVDGRNRCGLFYSRSASVFYVFRAGFSSLFFMVLVGRVFWPRNRPSHSQGKRVKKGPSHFMLYCRHPVAVSFFPVVLPFFCFSSAPSRSCTWGWAT